MKLTGYEKNRIESQCQPLIEKLKSQYVLKNPDVKYNYLADICIKWNRDYLYFCSKYKSGNPEGPDNEFEVNYVRLKVIKRDRFEISYMRHTEKWFMIAPDLTLNECLEMIEDIPTFHPA